MNLYHAYMNVNYIDPMGDFAFIPFLAYALILTAVDSAIGTGVDVYQGNEITTASQLKRVGGSFVINAITGGFATYGQAAKWGTKAVFASSVALDTTLGTAYDTAIRGQDFKSSLAMNFVGSVLGNGIALGITKRFGAAKGAGKSSAGEMGQLRIGSVPGLPGRASRSQYKNFVKEVKSLGYKVSQSKKILKATVSTEAKTVFINRRRATQAILIDEFSHVYNNVKGRGKWINNIADIEDHLHLVEFATRYGTSKMKPAKEFLFHQLEVENLINSGFKADFMLGSENLLKEWIRIGR